MSEDQSSAVSLKEFSDILSAGFADVVSAGLPIAVGVSGGPDSMALVRLLSDWAVDQGGIEIHALTVDHGLRAESRDEAQAVVASLQDFLCVTACVLSWDGAKPDSGVQEAARNARYRLMAEYCAEHAIEHLFLAHHRDDQAETFLFRLAKGSGLDGLSGMDAQQDLDGLVLCRPFLGVPKARLVALCDDCGVSYVRDPSNDSDAFARVRLRKSMDALAAEGLTVKRLAVTSMRMRRARQALEFVAEKAFVESVDFIDTNSIVFIYSRLAAWPDDIVLRVVLRAVKILRPRAGYAPRMEKIEALVSALFDDAPFRKRTLGGVVFARDDQGGYVVLEKEA